MPLTLQQARKCKLKTQQDLADLLGISKSTYSRKENNHIPFMQEELNKIKGFLELTDKEFIEIFFNLEVALKTT